MVSKRMIIIVTLMILGGGLLGACVSPASQAAPQGRLSLTAAETSKAVSKDIESFMVTLTHAGEADTEINVSLETTQGAAWKAALCYEEFCFIHNGRDRMTHTVPVVAGQDRRFEIKLFVPDTAGWGETKTLKMEAAPVENATAAASLELEGFIP